MVWADSCGFTGYTQVALCLQWNSLSEATKDMQMKESVKKGFGFGLTSGVITTLGMMVGLNASTGSRTAVIGGIIAIAIADAFSDAVGMHIS